MIDQRLLEAYLSALPIADIRFFETIGSTNDEAMRWVSQGAGDNSLVIAETQTQGRGRFNRRWITVPGASLAFSLILSPSESEKQHLPMFSPLGALAVCQGLEQVLNLQPEIKWPNDVLLNRRKVAGVLAEATWLGDQLQAVVVGIGININRAAVPPDDQVLFPAISIEHAAQESIDRYAVLAKVLQALLSWRNSLLSPGFHTSWENRLAFKNEWVKLSEDSEPDSPVTIGQVIGLDASGGLLLRLETGETTVVSIGDVHLRPGKPEK